MKSPTDFLEAFDAFVQQRYASTLYRYSGYKGGAGALLINVKKTNTKVAIRPWLRSRPVGLADIARSDERYRVFKQRRADVHVHVAVQFRRNAVRHTQASDKSSLVAFHARRRTVDVMQSANVPQPLFEALRAFCDESGLRAVFGFSGRVDIHPRVATASANLFRDGHYRNAVHDAALALISFVKEKSGRHDVDGAGLMTSVFSKKAPTITFNRLASQTDLDEQEGLMHLFLGVVLAIRNPRSHDLLLDDRERALEYLTLLSLLARRLEGAKRARGLRSKA